MEDGWSGDGDDDGDDLPSPEAKTASRLALPEKNIGWWRLRDENWENEFCSGFSSQLVKIGANVGHQRGWDPPRRPPGAARGAPGAPVSRLWPIFWPKTPSGAWIFCKFSGNFLGHLKIHIPAHKKTI